MTQARPIRTRPGFFKRWQTLGVIGVRMMFFDRLKLAGTLFGVVFAVVLGNFQVGTFLALLFKNRMFVENAAADIWVTPPGTRQFQGGSPLNDAQLNRARSTPGVLWAEPLLVQAAQLKLPNGGTEPVSLVGTRAPRFAGGPWNLVAGTADALLQPGAVIFEDSEREKFGGLNLGSVRELGGHHVQAVGFTWGLLPFAPAYAFAEQTLAREILKQPEGAHTFLLVKAAPGVPLTALRERLQRELPDTRVMTRDEYLAEILNYILTATQIGFSFGTSTFMGLLVGLITVALSMFSSVVDNMRQFGTIKAIGATTGDLARLLFVQAMVYGVVGSLIGLGMMAALVQGIRNAQLTPILPTASIGITFALMVGVCLVASVLALLRLRQLEPAMVFR
ncbi:MAG: ABC transporter permease [Archangium sp.]|nr:ABC transporter permease [Archangium sp.]